jgi:hypothetical protein
LLEKFEARSPFGGRAFFVNTPPKLAEMAIEGIKEIGDKIETCHYQ